MFKFLPDPVNFFIYIACFGGGLWLSNRFASKKAGTTGPRKNVFILSLVLFAAIAYTVVSQIH